MNEALAQFAPIVLAVWGLAEFIGRLSRWSKDRIAIVVGPLLAVAAFYVGFFPAAPSVWAAAFVGLVATASARLFADYVATPLMRRVSNAVHRPPNSGPKA